MKLASIALCGSLILGGGMMVAGCTSSQHPEVTSDHMTQTTMVAANTKDTTDAAKSVLKSLDLQNIWANATDVDGKLGATEADGTKISVNIEKADTGSKVSVSVGNTGNPTLGADIASKIKAKAEGH